MFAPFPQVLPRLHQFLHRPGPEMGCVDQSDNLNLNGIILVCSFPLIHRGRVAQLAEQLTLNQ